MKYKHLWAFKPEERKTPLVQDNPDDVHMSGYCAAPTLYPAGQAGKKVSAETPLETQIVDVVNDFPWTRSPREARLDVPQLIMTEHKIRVNPMVNKIANNLAVAHEKVGRFAKRLRGNEKDGIIGTVLGGVNNASSAVSTWVEESGDAGKRIIAAKDFLVANGDGSVMSSINNLYVTDPTHFKYKLPYLSSKATARSNQFIDGKGSTPQPMLHQALDDYSTWIANAATSVNILEPGTYIDNPKMYDYGSRDQKAYSVSIPLLNTSNNFQDVISNWQLIFMLVYQNTPNRITRDLIDPPRIYEARIKGLWYSRWSYIQNLSVDFVGPTRRMTLPIPIITENDSGDTQMELFMAQTVIPDAYQLNLTLQEIIPESQNSLYANMHEHPSKVTVTKDFSQIQDKQSPDDVVPPTGKTPEPDPNSGLGKLKKVAGTALQVAGVAAAAVATVKGLKR